jgi:hypothetical protein
LARKEALAHLVTALNEMIAAKEALRSTIGPYETADMATDYLRGAIRAATVTETLATPRESREKTTCRL